MPNCTAAPDLKSLVRVLVPYALSGLLSTLLSVILGRFLGAHAFGVVAIYLAYVMVLTALCTLGLSNSSVYLIPLFQKAKEMHHVRVFFLPAALLVIVVALLCAYFWGEMVEVFLPRALMHKLIPWMFPVLVASSLVNIFSGLLYSSRAAHLGALSAQMLPKLLWFVLCVVFYGVCPSSVAQDYIVLYIGALSVVTVFQVSELLLYFPKDVWRPRTLAPMGTVLSKTYPFFKSNAWNTLGDWVPLIVIHWVTQESLIAYYVAASKLAVDTILFLTNGMCDYVSSSMGQMTGAGADVQQRALTALSRVTWGIVLVYLAGVLVFAEPLMSLWGVDFARYWALVWVLSWATIMQTLQTLLTPLLNAHSPETVARGAILGTSSVTILSLAGGVVGGIEGFAVGISVAQTIQAVFLYQRTRRISSLGMRWAWGV